MVKCHSNSSSCDVRESSVSRRGFEGEEEQGEGEEREANAKRSGNVIETRVVVDLLDLAQDATDGSAVAQVSLHAGVCVGMACVCLGTRDDDATTCKTTK